MFNSKVPSTARSLDGKSTPRRYKKRHTRSVCSPARSDNSVKLTAMVADSFVVSPLPKRRSVLTDDTDIDMPKRYSWWKKLDGSSRDVMELLEYKDVPERNNMIEENFDVEILSQENKYTLDLPESSDSESINSIVIPQRKLFTQKENHPPKKFPLVINNREELPKLQRSCVDHVNEIDIRPKSLFNRAKKTKPIPIFPSALLNISLNKSIANKTELPAVESKSQVRNLFGNRPGIKRKNMFADFIVSESEDEISEIQPKVFGFQKKGETNRKMSYASSGLQHSPTCSIVDIDMDDWKHLPSSTMVENEIEEQAETPSKRTRLSKLLETKDMDTVSANKTINKTKLLNESITSKNRSKQFLSPKTNDNERKINISNKQGTDQISNTLVQPGETQNDANSSKQMKTFAVEEHEAPNYVFDKENIDHKVIEQNTDHDEFEKDEQRNNGNNERTNTLQGKQQTSPQTPNESDPEEDFTLEYENDEEISDHNVKRSENKVDDIPKEVLERSKSKETDKNITHRQISRETNIKVIAETRKSQNHAAEEEHRSNDKATKNGSSREISKNSKAHDDENDMIIKGTSSSDDNEERQNTENDNESKASQEIQDEGSGDEIEEPDEENEGERSENGEVEERSESEDEVNVTQNDNEGSHKEILNINEEGTDEESDNQDESDVADNNEQSEYHNRNASNREIKDNASTKITHTMSFTPENKKNNETKIDPPEAILYQDTNNLIASFTLKERNSPRKTKSMVRHNILPSLAPVRESTGFSDNTENSSANSVWDSHKITRKTLRKTFGADFTPRKSLRTLVMEKSAKRQTFNPDLRDISKHPHANSTELPMHEEKSAKRQTFNPDLHDISKHPHANSTELPMHEEKSAKRQTFNPDLRDISKHPHANSTELPRHEEKSAIRQTFDPDLHDISKHPYANSTELPMHEKKSTKRQTFNPYLRDISKYPHATSTELPVCDVNEGPEYSEVNTDEKNHGELEESDQDVNKTTEHSDVDTDEKNYEEIEESDEDVNETTEQAEDDTGEKTHAKIDESDQDINETIEHSEDDTGENNHAEIEKSDEDVNKTTEHSEDDTGEKTHAEIDESDQDINETIEHSEDDTGENNYAEIEESDEDVNETTEHSNDDMGKKNHAEIEDSDQDVNESTDHSEDDIVENHHTEMEETVEESDHELSKRMRQTTLDTYLQKIRTERLETEKKIREDIMNSLKVTRNRSCFELPYVMPIRRTLKPVQKKIKPKTIKTRDIYVLPEEIIEDLKYKPPKRFRPHNASWATKRLYKFLETKLEPKYDYMARVRAEKLVGTIYDFTKQVRRHEVAPMDAIAALKYEMARLKIVDTHYEFYHFFHEYMPREIRIKVNPDCVNKIQMPKDVFANIIQ